MSSSAAAAEPARPLPRTGRHSAPETPGELRIATPQDLLRLGRHAEDAWTRDLPIYDALRDELAAVDWFGLSSGRA